MAGLGPLVPGYIIVAPVAHVPTVAELDDVSFAEFLAVFDILVDSLHRQFGPGYTAYEHGRIGSCLVAEMQHDVSTFCFHAHRVIIPQQSNCENIVAKCFSEVVSLESPSALRQLSPTAASQYVFYETGTKDRVRYRSVFMQPELITSQFMRRMLVISLNLKRDWNWAADPDYGTVIDTTCRLRTETDALSDPATAPLEPQPKLLGTITVDGLAYVGKTTIAKALGQHFGIPVLETGGIFRRMAYCELQQLAIPNFDELLQDLTGTMPDYLKQPNVTELTSKRARDPEWRQTYQSLLTNILETCPAAIVIGRDCWRVVPRAALSLLITADITTRVRRRMLWLAQHSTATPTYSAVLDQITASDGRDAQKLPAAGQVGIVHVTNDHRPLRATLLEILSTLGSSE